MVGAGDVCYYSSIVFFRSILYCLEFCESNILCLFSMSAKVHTSMCVMRVMCAGRGDE